MYHFMCMIYVCVWWTHDLLFTQQLSNSLFHGHTISFYWLLTQQFHDLFSEVRESVMEYSAGPRLTKIPTARKREGGREGGREGEREGGNITMSCFI